MKAPTIETARLRLRAYRPEDFDAVAAMWRERAVFRYIGAATPLTDEDVWSKLIRSSGFWPLLGYGFWAVETRDGAALVGEVGFGDRRRTDPRLAGLPEVGWALTQAAQGHGYATEIVNAALAWADAAMTGRTTIAVISPDNGASIRLAQKCGYVEAFRAKSKGRPRVMFTR
jgi:RimJ/RimL family protein N-acetyltransferase